MTESIIKQIAQIANTSDGWDVLSALRGPDAQPEELGINVATTGVIRHKLGINNWAIVAGADTPSSLSVRTKLNYSDSLEYKAVGSHFIRHAKLAFVILGLKWNEVNL